MSNLSPINQRLEQIRSHNADFTLEEAAEVADFVRTWWSNSTPEEARTLIEIMKSVPSTAWFDVMYQAEHHDIDHWRLLLEHADRLYGRAADAAADEDGLTSAPIDNEAPRRS